MASGGSCSIEFDVILLARVYDKVQLKIVFLHTTHIFFSNSIITVWGHIIPSKLFTVKQSEGDHQR